ncbi:4'-phosphopantetheinyl transferase [Streptomyces sp. NPDC058297]|uniref:4'-phosphopantetheinyl transferase family protein n=1 Tax=Streptomyces sp. NPDC058297 TaxID=3346433 RepID=UPI0036E17388
MREPGGGDASGLALRLRGLLPPQVAVVARTAPLHRARLLAAERPAARSMGRARRSEFATGRALAREAMGRAGHIGHAAQALPVGAHRQPLWPEGLLGSISHSEGLFAVAVAPADGCWALGIDVERLARLGPRRVAALRSVVLTEAERRAAPRDTPDDVRALEIFSAKEAVFKALYGHVGRYFGFMAAEAVEQGPGRLLFRLTETLAPLLPVGTLIPVRVSSQDGVTVAAVCLEGAPARPVRRIDHPGITRDRTDRLVPTWTQGAIAPAGPPPPTTLEGSEQGWGRSAH